MQGLTHWLESHRNACFLSLESLRQHLLHSTSSLKAIFVYSLSSCHNLVSPFCPGHISVHIQSNLLSLSFISKLWEKYSGLVWTRSLSIHEANANVDARDPPLKIGCHSLGKGELYAGYTLHQGPNNWFVLFKSGNCCPSYKPPLPL